MRGVACHRSVADIPQAVELTVVATPAPTVPGVIEECGRAGIRHAVVITAGFSEMGAQGAVLEGAVLEGALLESARRHGLRLIGPNCLGIMRSAIGLNATFARGNAAPDPLGMISQSGAICTAMLDWARPNGVGFSSVVRSISSAMQTRRAMTPQCRPALQTRKSTACSRFSRRRR